MTSLIKRLRENRFWFSTFGTLAASAGLALFLKNDSPWQGLAWLGLCVTVISFILYPGRYDMSALEAALDAFYSAMEFPPDENIRCAIYVPIRRGNYLKQITSYMPGRQGGPGNKIHSSKGIVGSRAYREDEHRIAVLTDLNYSSAEFFQSQMVTRWGFTKDDARRLTQDRRAYWALIIKDEKHNTLGVLYCDSNKLCTFEHSKSFDRAQKFAAFFAELLKLRAR